MSRGEGTAEGSDAVARIRASHRRALRRGHALLVAATVLAVVAVPITADANASWSRTGEDLHYAFPALLVAVAAVLLAAGIGLVAANPSGGAAPAGDRALVAVTVALTIGAIMLSIAIVANRERVPVDVGGRQAFGAESRA